MLMSMFHCHLSIGKPTITVNVFVLSCNREFVFELIKMFLYWSSTNWLRKTHWPKAGHIIGRIFGDSFSCDLIIQSPNIIIPTFGCFNFAQPTFQGNFYQTKLCFLFKNVHPKQSHLGMHLSTSSNICENRWVIVHEGQLSRQCLAKENYHLQPVKLPLSLLAC